MTMRRSVKTLACVALAAIGAPMLFGTTCATQPQTCPSGQQLINGLCVTTPPPASLTGLWTGPITGTVTSNLVISPTPPNPNPFNSSQIIPVATTTQLEFDDSGLPAALPVPTTAFGFSLPFRAVTAFSVGQTQTIMSSFTLDIPFGAAATQHSVNSETITLTVTESDLSQAHFRVVYATTDVVTSTSTSASGGTTCNSDTASSSGKLTIEATASNDAINLSMEYSNTGTDSDTSGASPCPPAAPTTTTQTATTSGLLTGPLARL